MPVKNQPCHVTVGPARSTFQATVGSAISGRVVNDQESLAGAIGTLLTVSAYTSTVYVVAGSSGTSGTMYTASPMSDENTGTIPGITCPLKPAANVCPASSIGCEGPPAGVSVAVIVSVATSPSGPLLLGTMISR